MWFKINQNDKKKIFSFLYSKFGTWKNVGEFLGCGRQRLYNYRNDSTIPESIFNKIKIITPFKFDHEKLPQNWRQQKAGFIKNKLYGASFSLKTRVKSLEMQKLTKKEEVILKENRKLNLRFTNMKTHVSIIKNNEFANFDFVYYNKSKISFTEDIESSFSNNKKLNWFKVWRWIKKRNFISAPYIITWFPNYAFTPLMRLVLLNHGILPIKAKERMDVIQRISNWRNLISNQKIKCLKELEVFRKFSNAGVKGELKKPYFKKEQIIRNKLAKLYNSKGKVAIKDRFGCLCAIDDFIIINDKEYLVDFSVRNNIRDILRGAIGFCFMIDILFKKKYNKLIAFETNDKRNIVDFKLWQTLKEMCNIIINSSQMAGMM